MFPKDLIVVKNEREFKSDNDSIITILFDDKDKGCFYIKS